MPLSPTDLLTHLVKLGILTTWRDHPPIPTVAESKVLRGVVEGHHTKNLFLTDKRGGFFLIAARVDSRVDFKHLRKALGAAGRLSFGSADMLKDKLGVEPGTVTPFAVINDIANEVTVVLDAELMDGQRLNFLPLINTATIGIEREDLLHFLRAMLHEPMILALSPPR